ncbi:MAG: hypothetical protein WDN45_07975 [Caulobacteraceae bacterium]
MHDYRIECVPPEAPREVNIGARVAVPLQIGDRYTHRPPRRRLRSGRRGNQPAAGRPLERAMPRVRAATSVTPRPAPPSRAPLRRREMTLSDKELVALHNLGRQGGGRQRGLDQHRRRARPDRIGLRAAHARRLGDHAAGLGPGQRASPRAGRGRPDGRDRPTAAPFFQRWPVASCPEPWPRLANTARLALEAAVHARASGLDHVREKHETVAVHWTALAVFEEERGSELS